MIRSILASFLLSNKITEAFIGTGNTFFQTIEQSITPTKTKPNPVVLPLLEAASRTQSILNRIRVEQILEEELIPIALKNTITMQKPIQSGSYRTVWSTVTGDNFVGVLLNHPPSNILGGPSWQIVDGTQGTNIVYWKNFDLRMAGLASLSPLQNKNDGYDLQIRGLEFRWGAGGCPEQQTNYVRNRDVDIGNVWNVFTLPEDKKLGNGVGTLELLYNDGVVRVTRDALRDNTYIHIREPLSAEFEKMFSPYKL